MASTNSINAKPSAGIGVRYDETAALYTSQVVVNSLDDTVLLECSSGFVRSDTGAAVLPIEQRLAMSTDTARRLGSLLLEVADDIEGVESELPSPQLGQAWLSQAAKLQTTMRQALDTLPQWDDNSTSP